MTLRCGILTLKTLDSFFRSFRFLRQNGAFGATEQNQTYKNSLFFRNLNTIQLSNLSSAASVAPCNRTSFWHIPYWQTVDLEQSEKRKNTISQMRLRSVFKMRTSILNTATTEQMGYRVFSFFVYTKSTN